MHAEVRGVEVEIEVTKQDMYVQAGVAARDGRVKHHEGHMQGVRRFPANVRGRKAAGRGEEGYTAGVCVQELSAPLNT